MIESEVDFSEEIFPNHPGGWRSPSDLADAFVLALSLEEKERRRLDPVAPHGEHASQLLPACFRWDTLGQLLRPGSYEASSTSRGRLTSLCIVWRLFDELNARWRLSKGDFDKCSYALAYVTAATFESRGLFHGLDGNVARCLLSGRIARAYLGTAVLSPSEEWFVSGGQEFLEVGTYSSPSIPFVIGAQRVLVPVTYSEFTDSVWSTARVLVRLNTPDYYIAEFGDRTEMLLRILKIGADVVNSSPVNRQGWIHQAWPGWPE